MNAFRHEAERLVGTYPIISEQVDKQELFVIIAQLERLLAGDERGAVVEFGCYVGTTSLFIRRLLDTYGSDAEFHVYDSFDGLPEKSKQDASTAGEQFTQGALAATKKQFVTNFQKAHLRLPVIHKGWFGDLSPDQLPDSIMFAFLDGDYYQSIRDSLRMIEGRLTDASVIIVDDYMNEALPGAARAVDEWMSCHAPRRRLRVESSLAILTV